MDKRITIKGVRRKELDYDTISYVLFTIAKRRVEQRRKRQAAEKAAEEERKR